MSKRSLWDRIFYKYEYIEQIEKNGQIYKKYKKRHRFHFLRQNWRTIVYFVLFLLTIYILEFFRNTMQKK